MQNAVSYSHSLLNNLLNRFNQGIYIDGTLGNGHDIEFILSHPYFKGHVYGFDIQEQALINTQARLESNTNISSDHYTLIYDSHANIETHITENEIVGAIYNLGYLPGGDHAITTEFTITYTSVKAILSKLSIKGQIILVVYSGHDTGSIESKQLLTALAQLPQEEFQVLRYEFINQQNNPPFTLVIERIAN